MSINALSPPYLDHSWYNHGYPIISFINMARIKQPPNRLTGGKAPRKQVELCQGCSKVLPHGDQHYVCCSSCKHKFCEECEIDNLECCAPVANISSVRSVRWTTWIFVLLARRASVKNAMIYQGSVVGNVKKLHLCLALWNEDITISWGYIT